MCIEICMSWIFGTLFNRLIKRYRLEESFPRLNSDWRILSIHLKICFCIIRATFNFLKPILIWSGKKNLGKGLKHHKRATKHEKNIRKKERHGSSSIYKVFKICYMNMATWSRKHRVLHCQVGRNDIILMAGLFRIF